MINREHVAGSLHVIIPALLVIIVIGWAASQAATLTPLTGRPEDPDSTKIYDQNDLMAAPSPDGSQILFTSRRSGVFRQYVMNIDGSDAHVITHDPGSQMQGSWSPDGQKIAYIHRQRGEAGEPSERVLVVSNIDGSDRKTAAEILGSWPTASWTPDGKNILYHAPGPNGSDDIWSVDVGTGERSVVFGSDAADRQPWPSPDGSRIVFISKRDGDDDEVYVAKLNGDPWKQLTNNGVNDYTPSWSPDGSRIVFQSPRGGRWTILTINPDGTDETPITQYPAQYDPAWSADGSEIFFNSDRDGRRGIYVMNADGSNPRKLTNSEPSRFITVVRESGVDEAARLFRKERKGDPDAVFFYEGEVQYLGENYLEMGDLRKAILLFEVNAEAFPESKAAHVHLGNAHLAAGNPRLAAESYERALALDRDDLSLARVLKSLGE